MDTVRGSDRLDEDRGGEGVGAEAVIGTDERRMHVRAYNHWVSLLRGRPYPSIDDLDPGSIADFGANSVLLDFTRGIDDPVIRFLGRELRAECDVDAEITRVADVPGRSLLSRLTDHYLQIIANRAPIGFEAEFVGTRGHPTLYRGILMPFSSDADAIDYIYGVINWKEMVDPATQARLTAELEESRRSAPRTPPAAPAWADGPSGGLRPPVDDAVGTEDAATSLADRLMLARETAASVRAADTRSRAALYRALGRAYDFALAAEVDADALARLLADAGLPVQKRAPMTPIAKLVFGADHDKARLTEYAAVLSHARRLTLDAGALPAFIEAADGGLKGIVAAERAARRPAPRTDAVEDARATLRAAPAIGSLPIASDGAEFVVLLARADGDDSVAVLGRVDADDALVARAIRHIRQ